MSSKRAISTPILKNAHNNAVHSDGKLNLET